MRIAVNLFSRVFARSALKALSMAWQKSILTLQESNFHFLYLIRGKKNSARNACKNPKNRSIRASMVVFYEFKSPKIYTKSFISENSTTNKLAVFIVQFQAGLMLISLSRSSHESATCCDFLLPAKLYILRCHLDSHANSNSSFNLFDNDQ